MQRERHRRHLACQYRRKWYDARSLGSATTMAARQVWKISAERSTGRRGYDIEFQAPIFENGKKTAPGTMTVWWNGVNVHDNTKLTKDNTTAGRGGDPSKAGPLMLQDHGSPVQYRNIWLLPLK